jgi:uncharacterized protein (DUF1800 family)
MQSNLSRRNFLKVAGFTSLAAALWGCSGFTVGNEIRINATPAAPTPVQNGMAMVLRRITLGPGPYDLNRAKQLGISAYIEEQLNPEKIVDTNMEARLTGLATLTMNVAGLEAVEPKNRPALELMQASLIREIYSARQLYEIMVNFWSDHFNIYIGKTLDRYLKTVDDRVVERTYTLGNFGDLLMASAKSPAMLIYLDNATSTKNGPNENYARELMELHTLSPASGYTQQDVEEVARTLTGWTITGQNAPDPGEFIFRPGLHDDGEKTILGVRFPAGQGEKDGEQLLAMLASHPSTAQFISTKLARRFVADQPPVTLVSRCAQVFLQSEGNITAVLRAILNSDEFYASLGQKPKRPIEFVTSALRSTSAQVVVGQPLINILTMMGQQPFGWLSPNGYPDVGSAWLTTNDLLARWNFALGLAVGSVPGVQVDWPSLVGSASTLEEAIQAMSTALLGGSLPAQVQQFFVDHLGSLDVAAAAAPLGALLLASPFFQYR